jgi:hypothetical protein
VTTATSPAPTEEDIRATLVRAFHEPGLGRGSLSLRWDDIPYDWSTLTDDLYDMEEMRPSEIARLDELRRGAVEALFDGLDRRLVEALVAATLAFAAEHPDAPRMRGRTEAAE